APGVAPPPPPRRDPSRAVKAWRCAHVAGTGAGPPLGSRVPAPPQDFCRVGSPCRTIRRPPRENAKAFSSGCCEDALDVFLGEELRRRRDAGVDASESVHRCLVATLGGEELLDLGWGGSRRRELCSELVEREHVLVAHRLVVGHRRVEWSCAR